jgi:hypothetical protein
MERTWYVIAIAKISIIFRGRFINPKQRFTAYMTDGELNNLRDDIEIVEYRDNKDFPQSNETYQSQPIIEENKNSKGEENGEHSCRTNKTKNKGQVSKSNNKRC